MTTNLPCAGQSTESDPQGDRPPKHAEDRMRSSRVLRPPEASQHTGLSESCLAKRRLSGSAPPFVKLSRRAVGYRLVDLDEWIASRIRQSTSESEG